MDSSTSIKVALIAALNTIAPISGCSAQPDATAGEETSVGQIEGEDRGHIPTVEPGFDHYDHNAAMPFPRNPAATLSSPQVKERISGLLDELGNSNKTATFSPQLAMTALLSSEAINSERAIFLVDEILKRPDFSQLSESDLVQHIANSKVML